LAVINSLWIGGQLSPLERACAQSFINHGHQFNLYVYDAIDNAPARCQLLDAGHIMPAAAVFAHAEGVAKGSFATFSDLFRFKLLYELGGWWMDMDMFCLTPTLPAGDIVIGRQDRQLINDAALHFPPKHPAMQALFADAQARGQNAGWTEIGPQLVTRYFAAGPLAAAVLPPSVFYPIHYSQFWNVFDPRRTTHAAECIRSSAGLHFWNEMIRRAQIDKHVLPPDGSLLRNLYEWTIGTEGFTHEYVLSPDCPQDSLALALVERR